MEQIKKLNIKILSVMYVLLAFVDYIFIDMGWVHRLFIILSVIFVVKISNYFIPMGRFFKIALPAVFFVYLSHKHMYAFINLFYHKTLNMYMIMWFAKPILAFILALFIFYAMQKYCSPFLAILTGGRTTHISLKKG